MNHRIILFVTINMQVYFSLSFLYSLNSASAASAAARVTRVSCVRRMLITHNKCVRTFAKCSVCVLTAVVFLLVFAKPSTSAAMSDRSAVASPSRVGVALRSFESQLRCRDSRRASGEKGSPSAVGDSYPLVCDDTLGTYSRSVFDLNVTFDTDRESVVGSHLFLAVPSVHAGASPLTALHVDRCADISPRTARSPYCDKIEVPLRTSNGSFSLASREDIATLLGLSVIDAQHIVQGLEITVRAGHARWAYDLDPLPSGVFPFGYDFSVNSTRAAFDEARDAALLDSGLVTKLARCYPPISQSSARLGGALNACFRAACNCTGVGSKPAHVPDLYTYEVQWREPGCQIRRVRVGTPRLTVDVTVSVSAVVMLNGTRIYDAVLTTQRFPDVTSAFSASSALGDLGGGSGVRDISQRAYSSTGPFSFAMGGGYRRTASSGSARPSVNVDEKRFAGASSSTLLRFSSKLVDTYVGDMSDPLAPLLSLGGSSSAVGSTAHFNLAGGYVIDCLSDAQASHSKYRQGTANPYNVYGIPASGVPPDAWLFLCDALSRRGATFSTHARDSCGLLGTSSASIALGGGVANRSLCCDGSLIAGACAPGSTHKNAFPSPAQVLRNSTLWQSSFAPKGFRHFNYYLYGRNKLYVQPTRRNVSYAAPPSLNAPVGARFRLTLELSDILMRPASGALASSLVPPLRFAKAESVSQRAYSSDSILGCAYTTDGTGVGVISISRLCNVASSTASANVSLSFVGCGDEIRLRDANGPILSKAKPLPVNDGYSLQAGACLDLFTVPIFVERAYNVSAFDALTLSPLPACRAVVASSTSGSTNDAVYNNLVCHPLHRDWNGGVQPASNYTVSSSVVDPNCSHCESLDFYCLAQCGRQLSTLLSVAVIWVPLILGGGTVLTAFIVAAINCLQQSRSGGGLAPKSKEQLVREMIFTDRMHVN